MLMLTLLFTLNASATRPDVELARYVGPFQLVSKLELPVTSSNQESRWQIVGYLDRRKFRAQLTCVWMPAGDKYARYTRRFCQPVAFEYL